MTITIVVGAVYFRQLPQVYPVVHVPLMLHLKKRVSRRVLTLGAAVLRIIAVWRGIAGMFLRGLRSLLLHIPRILRGVCLRRPCTGIRNSLSKHLSVGRNSSLHPFED